MVGGKDGPLCMLRQSGGPGLTKLGVPWGYVVSMLERYKRVGRSAEERPVHLSALIR
jgi:hypothetical protein